LRDPQALLAILRREPDYAEAFRSAFPASPGSIAIEQSGKQSPRSNERCWPAIHHSTGISSRGRKRRCRPPRRATWRYSGKTRSVRPAIPSTPSRTVR
jgi:hypothetical protein